MEDGISDEGAHVVASEGGDVDKPQQEGEQDDQHATMGLTKEGGRGDVY